jgi:FMN reductase
MTLPTLVGFAGSFSRPSRTRFLVEAVAGAIAARYPVETSIHDLVDVGPSLGAARRLTDLDSKAARIVQEMLEADVLVVGSPVYKGSYAGLFKHLFDLIDPQALSGKPVVLTATGGSDRHALILEHQLRPLFGFSATHTLPSGVYATDRDFVGERGFSDPIHDRIALTVGELAAFLRRAPVLAAARAAH